MQPLDPGTIEHALRALPHWSLHRGKLTRTLRFPDFMAGLAWVNQAAEVAEQLQHHPELLLRWGAVTIALWTHDVGAITTRDIDLAHALEALAPSSATRSPSSHTS